MQTQIIAGTRSIIGEMQDKQLALLRNITQREALLYERCPLESVATCPLIPDPPNEKRKGSWLRFPENSRMFGTFEGLPLVPALRSARRRHLAGLKDCSCRCHRRSLVRIIWVTYSWSFRVYRWGYTFFNKYYLSPRLTANAIRFTLIFSMHRPSVSVQTHNNIPYNSPIHLTIQNGQTEKAKPLLCSGFASLNDVDTVRPRVTLCKYCSPRYMT